VQRFQDIPSEYKKTSVGGARLFVSYKWEDDNHPDRSMRTLERLLRLTQAASDDVGVWWDYCSLPQKNVRGFDDRTDDLRNFFKFQLSLIPLIILDSQCMFLWNERGASSGWCCSEFLLAQAILQSLNKAIYKRKDDFSKPPLYVTQIGNQTLVESDLYRFDHRIEAKIYCDEMVMEAHRSLIQWMNVQANEGRPTPYTEVIGKATPDLIYRMMEEHRKEFGNPADHQVLSDMLAAIYRKLSFEPLDRFKWSGQVEFSSMWHYVKGCFGNCVVPVVAYSF